MISQFVSVSPTSGSVLTARSLEPVSDSVSLALCPSPGSCSVSFCLSDINKNIYNVPRAKTEVHAAWEAVVDAFRRSHRIPCMRLPGSKARGLGGGRQGTLPPCLPLVFVSVPGQTGWLKLQKLPLAHSGGQKSEMQGQQASRGGPFLPLPAPCGPSLRLGSLGLQLCHSSLYVHCHMAFFLCVCVSFKDTSPWHRAHSTPI